jgi:hypothetical protein
MGSALVGLGLDSESGRGVSHNDPVLRPERPRTGHVVAALVLVAYWAAMTFGSQFAVDPPGILRRLWYDGPLWVTGLVLAFVVGLYVARWWLLLAALTPVVVLGALELAARRSPWHDSGPPLTQYGWFYVVWWFFWFFFLPVGLGIAIRRGLGERGVGNSGLESSV